MNYKLKRILAIFVFLILNSQLLTPNSFAASSQRGTSAANFLKIIPGARQAGMAGVAVALADDVFTLHGNPGGIALLPQGQFAASRVSYFQSIDFNYLGTVLPLPLKGPAGEHRHSVGLSITNLQVDGIEKRTSDQDTPEGTFAAGDYAYQVSYGRKMGHSFYGRDWSLGGSVKHINSKIDSFSASAWALDAGILVHNPVAHMRRAGFSIRNLGTEMKFNEVGDPLPLAVSLGGLMGLMGDKLSVVPEINIPRDNDVSAALGLEYTMAIKGDFSMALRGGFTTGTSVKSGLHGVSAGLGFGSKAFGFDFGWVPFGDLGDTFRYSLIAKF